MSIKPRNFMLIIFIFLVGCGGVPTIIVKESWRAVNIITAEEITKEDTETVVVKNCGSIAGKEVTCSAGMITEFSWELNGQLGIGNTPEVEIGGGIASALGIGRESGDVTQLKLPPSGWIYEYSVTKTFTVTEGDALARSSSGSETIIPYVFYTSCSIDVEPIPERQYTCSQDGVEPSDEHNSQTPSLESPQFISSEERVPPAPSTSMSITVNDDEIHAVTGGAICVSGVCLPGGTDRGSVVILLPSATYELTGLVSTWNWHGVYLGTASQWPELAEKHTAEQKIPGTCSDGDGCSTIDVLVVGPNGVVEQYVD